jgi:hypothetical protein
MNDNMNTTNTGNNTPGAGSGSGPETKEGSAGPLVGSTIVIIIIILGGLYFLNQRASDDATDTGTTGDEIRLEEDSAALDLAAQSESDEVGDIETDLDITELDDLDEELGDIDVELNF